MAKARTPRKHKNMNVKGTSKKQNKAAKAAFMKFPDLVPKSKLVNSIFMRGKKKRKSK